MDNIKVSVVIPVYNAEDFIGECLDSLLSQSLREIEIICVNDGSLDDTAVILEEYKKYDSRIKVLHQKNQGAAVARNAGIEIAQGNYISILDSDDFFNSEMLKKMYEKSMELDLDVAICKVRFYDQNERKYQRCDWAVRDYLCPNQEVFGAKDVSANIFQFANGWAWDKMWKKEFLQKNKLEFQNTKIFNDAFFVFMGLANAERIYIVNEVLATKRREVKTAISSSKNKNWREFVKLIRRMKQTLEQNEQMQLFEQSFINYALHLPIYLFRSVDIKNKIMMWKFLKESYFNDMEFSKYPSDYYYDKKEYSLYKLLSN